MGILFFIAIIVVVYFATVKTLNFIIDYIFRDLDD